MNSLIWVGFYIAAGWVMLKLVLEFIFIILCVIGLVCCGIWSHIQEFKRIKRDAARLKKRDEYWECMMKGS